jgi:hypothetical protein
MYASSEATYDVTRDARCRIVATLVRSLAACWTQQSRGLLDSVAKLDLEVLLLPPR